MTIPALEATLRRAVKTTISVLASSELHENVTQETAQVTLRKPADARQTGKNLSHDSLNFNNIASCRVLLLPLDEA